MHPRRFGFLVFCVRIAAGPAGLYPLANFECSGRSDVRSCVWTAFIGRLMAAWAAHLQQDKSLPLSLTGRAWAAHFAFSHGRARARYGKANFHGVLLVRHTFELMVFVLGFPEASFYVASTAFWIFGFLCHNCCRACGFVPAGKL